MPLINSPSEKAFKHNIAEEMKSKPPEQAAAIAYSIQREHKNDGYDAHDYEPTAIETVPEGVTLETLNQINRKYWYQGEE